MIALETRGLTRRFGALTVTDAVDFTLHRRVRLGLARTFQLNTLLREATVLENVQLAVLEHRGFGARLLGGALRQRRAAEAAFAVLESLGMADHAGQVVAALPYGRQRLVEVAIALALRPTVLLLDEPAAGVPPADSHLMLDVLAALPANIAVLIIEHDMNLVFRFAERISVLVQGRLLAEGAPPRSPPIRWCARSIWGPGRDGTEKPCKGHVA